MTPAELLENAKSSIDEYHLLVGEDAMAAQLKIALGEFQARSGCTKTERLTLEEAGQGKDVGFTEDDVIFAVDKSGEYYDVNFEGSRIFVCDIDDYSEAPFNVDYAVDLRNLDTDNGVIPRKAIQPVLRYLIVLIKILNYSQVNSAYLASGMDTSELESLESLQTQKQAIEQEMSAIKADISPGAVFE